jgi:hypothetical protein
VKNVIILGSGRSGTSMVAGALSCTGYFMGEKLIDPSPANPKGFFEDGKVNYINDRILLCHAPLWRRLPIISKIRAEAPGPNQLWLSRVCLDAPLRRSDAIVYDIKSLTSVEPFCFKDPRFCYTLPIWRPYIKNARFVCVFRHPSQTVSSIMREATSEYLHNLAITEEIAEEIWCLMYTHIVDRHMRDGKWLFLHYRQMFYEQSVAALEEFVEAEIARGFPDKKLDRSRKISPASVRAEDLYIKLCALARYDPARDVMDTSEQPAHPEHNRTRIRR